MANKMYEIAFRIAAAVDGRFNSAFVTASEKMAAMHAKTVQMKSSMDQFGKMYSNGALTAAEYGRALAKVGAEIERNEKLQKRYAAAKRLQDQAEKIAPKAQSAMVASAAVGAAVMVPAMKAIDFETAMADVTKQVDGASDAQGKLTEIGLAAKADIMDLSRELMMSPIEIAKAYEFAARSGVSGSEQLRKVTALGVKLGTAFKLPREQVTEDMAKIINVLGYDLKTEKGAAVMEDIGDRLNYLDDKTQAKGQGLLDWMKRFGKDKSGMAKSMTEGFAMGLGAGFAEVGVEAEMAETAMRNLLVKFTAPVREGKEFQWALAQIEVDANNLQESMIKDADRTIMAVFERLNNLDEGDRLNVMSELFGKEHIGNLSLLSSNMKKFTDMIKLANSEEAKGSAQREFNRGNTTTKRQMEGATAGGERAAITAGDSLLPRLQEKAKTLSDFAEKIGEFAKAHPELTSNVMTGTAALAAWGLGLSAATWIVSSAVGPLMGFTKWLLFSRIATDGTVIASRAAVAWAYIEMAGLYAKAGVLKIVTAAQWLWNAALTANPIGLVIAGIAALVLAGMWLFHNWEKVREFMTTLWDSPAFAALAFITGPIGWLIYAVAGIIANWEQVKAWFTLLWNDPGEAVRQFADMIMSKLGGALQWLEDKWNSLKNLFSGGLGGGAAGLPDISMQVPGYATGIITDIPHLAMVAEGGVAEAIIPMDGSNRAVSLWQQAGSMLGMEDSGGKTVQVSYRAGDIYVYGNADPGQVKQEQESANKSFLDYLHNERRVSFADG